MPSSVLVIGAGFAGLSAACFLAKKGFQVTVLEQHDHPGGRARQLTAQGFHFDMGPSWYWMPDVFEKFFAAFGKKVSDYYELTRLDPSYRVYWPDTHWDIPADYETQKAFFESVEPGAGNALDLFMKEAAFKYRTGMEKLVYKPGLSLAEFADADVLKGLLRMDILTSMKAHVGKYFHHPRLRQLLEFPVLFLGALPDKIPALYSLMNYADVKGGTWYPKGGMVRIAEGMYQLARELGVVFHFGEEVQKMNVEKQKINSVFTFNKNCQCTAAFRADYVVSGADYHHTETDLLPAGKRQYSDKYWDSRVMAPGCLLYYVGLSRRIPGIQHHSLFFDTPFEAHGKEIYSSPAWPSNPLFYVSATSVTDPDVAPPGHENLFFLIPVAAGLTGDDEALRKHYFDQMIERFGKRLGISIAESIVYYRSFALSDFVSEYHSYKGNAYGLANTLMQTALLKPRCKSNKVKNLYFTGQLTVPGPGVPPSLISGELVAGIMPSPV